MLGFRVPWYSRVHVLLVAHVERIWLAIGRQACDYFVPVKRHTDLQHVETRKSVICVQMSLAYVIYAHTTAAEREPEKWPINKISVLSYVCVAADTMPW